MAEFSHPTVFEVPLGEPLECRDEIWHQKTSIGGLPDGEKIFLRFDTTPARDGQTDGHVALAKTRASIASRG